MMRRIKIIMDYKHKIEPDRKTNYVVFRFMPYVIEAMSDEEYGLRETLVIQP